jgi:hypothetical protein
VAFSYVIPRDRTQALAAGQTGAALLGWGDVPAGWDFSPVADRARLVSAIDENARINPFTGSLARNDTDITPAATTTLIGAAYDRNIDGATATTLFAIDRNDSELVRIGGVDGTPSPNGGVATAVGPLGVVLSAGSDAGFDIAPDGTAFAALTAAADNLTRLYAINLATGASTPIGLIGNGTTEVRSLAVVPPRPTGPTGPTGPAARRPRTGDHPPGGCSGQPQESRASPAQAHGAAGHDDGGPGHAGGAPRLATRGAGEPPGPARTRADRAAPASGTRALHAAAHRGGGGADREGQRALEGHSVDAPGRI